MKIRLTEAQVSALECAGLGIEPGDEILIAAWNGRSIDVTPETREPLFSLLNELSNSEDSAADIERDPFLRRYGNAAARSLACIASRVLRSRP